MKGGQLTLTPFQFPEGIQERFLNKVLVATFARLLARLIHLSW